ncbi:response regulator transcription factor [Frankia sp. AgB1.9]|nr:response regulator transcription factor [Frankia sp. AgW1.1]MBL7551394.1 response regulator transcription factor [Frankia sp. AgB1.9]MBL7620729.1 response regulator transcription factor [Frankia sp. AgB1.8]
MRLLVVDDHPLFRDGIAASLARVSDFEVVAVAETGEQAVDLAAETRPDVVLMDLNLPGISGVEATRRIVAAAPTVAVLAVTMVDDDDTVLAAIRAGAAGYVLKGSTGEEIAAATRTAAGGGAVFGAGVAKNLLAATLGRRPVGDDRLTDRERDVLAMIAEGATNQQIARALGLSLKTVQNYVSRVLEKLQVTDRTQAAIRARDGRAG